MLPPPVPQTPFSPDFNPIGASDPPADVDAAAALLEMSGSGPRKTISLPKRKARRPANDRISNVTPAEGASDPTVASSSSGPGIARVPTPVVFESSVDQQQPAAAFTQPAAAFTQPAAPIQVPAVPFQQLEGSFQPSATWDPAATLLPYQSGFAFAQQQTGVGYDAVPGPSGPPSAFAAPPLPVFPASQQPAAAIQAAYDSNAPSGTNMMYSSSGFGYPPAPQYFPAGVPWANFGGQTGMGMMPTPYYSGTGPSQQSNVAGPNVGGFDGSTGMGLGAGESSLDLSDPLVNELLRHFEETSLAGVALPAGALLSI